MSDERPVVAYAVGLVSMSVCAQDSASREEVERYANDNYPTGITSPWAIADDDTFATGESNPTPCNQEAGRMHFLLHC